MRSHMSKFIVVSTRGLAERHDHYQRPPSISLHPNINIIKHLKNIPISMYNNNIRPKSQKTTAEKFEDLKHRLIVRAIEAASDTLMERNQTSDESYYWQNTNVVRRNLLMTAVRRSLWDEWSPEGEAGSHIREASIGALRPLALRCLSDTIANHIRSNNSPSPSPPPF